MNVASSWFMEGHMTESRFSARTMFRNRRARTGDNVGGTLAE
ncbi:MAG: hypothetical protein Q4C47_01545 [Planctomycetia bacterium]|nr:hypothetical protein [Planctomycetia bacterium]